MFQSHTRRTLLATLITCLVLGLFLLPLVTFALPARTVDNGVYDPPPGGVQILRQVIVGNQVQTTISIPASQSTFIASGYPNNNFGYATQLGIGYNSPNYQAMRILIKFSLSAIPANATINSATFQIFQYQSIPANDAVMGIQAQFASRSWDEASATWSNANNIGENPPIGVGNFDNTTGWKYGNATNVVQQWYSGKPNNGVLFIGDESPGPNRSRWFYSNYQASYYPRLTVDYTMQCDNIPPTAYITSITPQVLFNGNSYSPAGFRVSWTGSDSAPAGCPVSGVNSYKIWYSTDNANWAEWVPWGTATSATFNLSLPSGTRIFFYAQAQDNAGNKQAVPGAGSGQMNTILDTNGPAASVSPLPQYTTNTSFVVSWSAGDDVSGAVTYNFQQSLNGGAWQTLLSNTPQTSYQITGATTGQQYAFRAQAIDRVGNVGAWSPSVSTTIFANPLAILQPITPPVIQSTTPNSNTINLYWSGLTPPGTSITQYTVWVKFNSGGWTALLPVQPGGATGSYQFKISTQGFGDGWYYFKVTATNNAGQSTPPNLVYGQASVIVDYAGKIKVRARLPVVYSYVP